MRKGEKAILEISSKYGYGAEGNPPRVPENADLEYEIEIMDIHDRELTKWDYTA